MIKNLDEAVKSVSSFKGITDDSRSVGKDFIFVAIKGVGHDGHRFINDAVKNGAGLIVGEEDLHLENYIKVVDSREALGTLASAFYGNPSQKLKVIGVTGTKGKTTTCHIIGHILSSLGKKVGILSSISVPGLHVTTPDPVFLHKKLAEFVSGAKEYAVIEVSSHGVAQKRIAGIKFDVGVLTNIAPEHLDYHKTFSEYKKVKMSFINSCNEKVVAPKKSSINVLPGEYNNINAEAAIGAVSKFGIDKAKAMKSLESFELPEGRLMEIKNDLGIKIIIDFAHTPDSLEAVLKHLKKETKGSLIAVFGCAGERDPRKRFAMGKVSGKLANLSVFTAEDPRTENLFEILAKMAKGARSAGTVEGSDFVRIYERGEAIPFALSHAKKGDTVAILGKGHEKSMSFDGWEHPWSDKEIIENFLGRNKNLSAIILAAGKGSRMHSDLPKILHKICGRPMISYSLENLRAAGIGDITAVISFKRNIVSKYIKGAINLAIQKNPKGGTGEATKCGLNLVGPDSKYVLVFYGDDSAFFKPETIHNAIREHIKDDATVSFASAVVENPYGLGRVLRNSEGKVLGIVEEKAANDDQKKIKEINCGNFIFNKDWLVKNINKLEKSASGEYYINNLVQAAIDQNKKVMAYKLKDRWEWQGINTPEELEKARIKMEARLKDLNG